MSHKWLDICWETTECNGEETTAIHPRTNAAFLVPIDPEHVEIIEVTLAWTVTFEQPGFQTDVRSVTTAWFAGLATFETLPAVRCHRQFALVTMSQMSVPK
jgi:hypothetical protein